MENSFAATNRAVPAPLLVIQSCAQRSGGAAGENIDLRFRALLAVAVP